MNEQSANQQVLILGRLVRGVGTTTQIKEYIMTIDVTRRRFTLTGATAALAGSRPGSWNGGSQ